MRHPQIITLQELSKLLRHHAPLRLAMIVKEIEIHSPTPWVHGIKIRSISLNPRHQLSVLTRLHLGPSMEYSSFWKNFTKCLSVFSETSSSMASASPSFWFLSAPSRDAMKVAGMPTFLQLLGKCSPWGIPPQGNDRVTRHGGNLSLRMSTNSHKMRSWGEQYVGWD